MTFRPSALSLLLVLATGLSLHAGQATAAGGDRVVVRALAAGGKQPLPVSGARVVVVEDGRVIGRSRTGSRGMAAVSTRGARNGKLRVVVRGGQLGKRPFGGRLLADVSRYTWPDTVHVSSITTLAARYAKAHPGVSGDQVKRRTRSFLRLPQRFMLGRDSATHFAFDGRRFLADAARQGGYDRFVGQLVERMERTHARRSFAPRRGGSRAGARAGASALNGVGGAAELGAAISAGSGFFEALEKTDFVLDFADAVVSLTGIGDDAASAAEIAALSTQLQQVDEDLAELRGEVEHLREQFARSAYSSLANENRRTHETIVTSGQHIQSAMQFALQGGCDGSMKVPADCEEAENLIALLRKEFEKSGPDTVAELNAYAADIGGAALPNSDGVSEGLLQMASAITTQGEVFYNPAESQLLNRVAGYWIASYAQALAIAPAIWLMQKEPRGIVETQVGEVMSIAKAMPAVVPDLVPDGTVVEMVHGVMWPTLASAEGSRYSWSWFDASQPWDYVGGAWVSRANGTRIPAIGSPAESDVPFGDWEVAGLGHINPLLGVVDPQAGESPGEAVLAQGGFNRDIVIPAYGAIAKAPAGRGLEMEYQLAGNSYTIEEGLSVNSGCRGRLGAASCYWPVWVGDNATVGNFNRPAATHRYREAIFKVSDPLDISWYGSPLWGYDNDGTIFGNDPLANVPFLFYRQVTAGECYYYPQPGTPSGGAAGCPR